MRYLIALAFCVIPFFEANGQYNLQIVCDHSSGISTKSGLRSDRRPYVFDVQYDESSDEFRSDGHPASNLHDFVLSRDYIEWSWFSEMGTGPAWWKYLLNRHTGHLYVRMLANDEIWVAEGICVKSNRKF